MQLQSARAVTKPLTAFQSAEHRGTKVTVTDTHGDQIELPLIWLRDNCVCADCRIMSTGEHRYFLGRVDEVPTAVVVTIREHALVIDWSDGHTTTLSATDLAHLTNIADRSHLAARLWSDDFEPERFDHDAVLNDTDTRAEFLTASLRDGLTIVTDMPNESGDCIRFLEALQVPIRETPFDRLHDVFYRSDGYNVAHTDEALPPHNDFASYGWPPSGQLIHMLVNEVEGGEWVNVDGFKVLARLSQTNPEAVQTLARVSIAFREHSDIAESWTRAPIVRTDGMGNITGIRFSNQLMQPMSPLDPNVEAFYEAYHLLAKAVSNPDNQIEFRGHGGTMQFVHGHRILHARRAFDPGTGDRHLQDTYFDFDDIASLVARITGEAR